MGYPTSVFAPTARSNGQTIDASHVNDLQTEVTAVENALLGTITHSVNVSGASTLATLQAAASTFSVRPQMPPPEMALVFLQSSATVGSSAASTIAWTGQTSIQNSSMHSTATNPSRLIPQTTGMYRFCAQVTFAPTSGATPSVYLRDSSAAAFAFTNGVAPAQNLSLQVIGYKRFDVVGSYVVVELNPLGYSTLSILPNSDVTWCSMEKL